MKSKKTLETCLEFCWIRWLFYHRSSSRKKSVWIVVQSACHVCHSCSVISTLVDGTFSIFVCVELAHDVRARLRQISDIVVKSFDFIVFRFNYLLRFCFVSQQRLIFRFRPGVVYSRLSVLISQCKSDNDADNGKPRFKRLNHFKTPYSRQRAKRKTKIPPNSPRALFENSQNTKPTI